MSSIAGGGVNIGGYRMRVSVRRPSYTTARNNISNMMLRSQVRRETTNSAQVMNGGHIGPESRSSRRYYRSNLQTTGRQRYGGGANAGGGAHLLHNVGIIQSLIRRDRTDHTPTSATSSSSSSSPSLSLVDLLDLEVRAEALEVLRSSLVLTLRSTGDVRVWLNILRQYREALIFPPHRIGSNVFRNLPSVDISEEDVQCSICLRDFKIGDKAKSLPCDHKFHSSCIRPWLKRSMTCPMCRHQLAPTPPSTLPVPAVILPVRRSASSNRHRYVTLE